jgi:hypothetical protein
VVLKMEATSLFFYGLHADIYSRSEKMFWVRSYMLCWAGKSSNYASMEISIFKYLQNKQKGL